MELRHLRYFAAVAVEGGFGRAATTLHLAQPALSRQIKDLEKELRVQLLERTPKGVTPTAAGDALVAASEKVFAAVEEAVAETRLAAAGHTGQCKLGLGAVVMAVDVIANRVASLPEEVAGLDLVVHEGDGASLGERVASGGLDCGVAVLAQNWDALARELLMAAHFQCAAMHAAHPLAAREFLEPDDLADETVLWLSPERAPLIAEAARLGLERAGIKSHREFIYSSAKSAMMMVVAGRGWVPAPIEILSRPPQGLVLVPLRGLDFSLPVEVFWRKSESRPIVHRAVRALLAKTHEESGRAPRHSGGSRSTAAIELRHLRAFAAVTEEGSFGGAAKKLGTTQPSLSRQVSDLEYHVGAPLLERAPRGVTATDAGRILRASLRHVFGAVDDLISATRSARRGMAGRCVIGAIHTQGVGAMLRQVVLASAERWPHLELFLEEYPTPRQPDLLLEGAIDIGICHAYASLTGEPGLLHERLKDDSVTCALLAESHPLAARDSIQAVELSDHPFLFMTRSFHPLFYDRVFAAFGQIGLKPRVETEVSSLQQSWALAAINAGFCIGFTSHRAAPPTGLKAVPIEGFDMPWGLEMMWRRNEPNPIVERVLGVLREIRDGVPAVPEPQARAPRARRSAPRRTRTARTSR